LKERIEQDITTECARAEIVNLAVDGWSDQRGRQYQAITARRVDRPTLTAWTRLLAVKEIKSIRESAGELHAIVNRVQLRYGIQERTVNLCSDRASLNESAFCRTGVYPLSIFHGGLLWLPCTCHMLKNILTFFINRIRHRLKPIFYLQQSFRKCGPFLAYLIQEQSVIT
jgi:hypothetical protein